MNNPASHWLVLIRPLLAGFDSTRDNVPTAGAILDRFLHHAITMAISGRSYRVKDSLPAAAPSKKGNKSSEPLTVGGAS